MASFVILRHSDASTHSGLENTVFVRDAFSAAALIMPLIWLLWNRLWVHAALVAFAFVLLFAMVQNIDFALFSYFMGLILALFVAAEGPVWRIKALMHDGYVQSGVIDANNHNEAELKWAMHKPVESAPQKPFEKPRGKLINAPSKNIQDDLILGSGGSER